MRRIACAGALLLTLASGAAQAGGHSLAINASVLGSCQFIAPSSILSFVLDPLAGGTLRQTAAVQFRCAKGIPASVTVKSLSTGFAAAGNLLRGAESIPYAIRTTGGGGAANGKVKTLSVRVSINQAASASVSSGLYTDTIAITVAP